MFRVAIVGAGGIGRYHADSILRINELTLVAVADIMEDRAEKMAQAHNALWFTDYKKMCDEVEFDAVIINLPHYLHCESSIFFMERGIHVLVEKPMAMNVEECDKMIAAAEKYGVRLAVGHVQKYYSAYRQIRQFVEDGTLGKLCMITEIRNVDYSTNRAPWFLTKSQSGGGIVMNYCAHSLDKIMFATGLKVEKVHAKLTNPITDHDVELSAQVLFELTGGVTAAVTYCGCHVPSEYNAAFYFTDGVAKINGPKDLVVFKKDETIEYGGTEDLFDEQLIEFVKLLEGKESQIVMPDYGREVIRVIEDVYKEGLK